MSNEGERRDETCLNKVDSLFSETRQSSIIKISKKNGILFWKQKEP
jgi:hypothetical protein